MVGSSRLRHDGGQERRDRGRGALPHRAALRRTTASTATPSSLSSDEPAAETAFWLSELVVSEFAVSALAVSAFCVNAFAVSEFSLVPFTWVPALAGSVPPRVAASARGAATRAIMLRRIVMFLLSLA